MPEADEKLRRDDVLAVVRRLRLDREGCGSSQLIENERQGCFARWADGMSDAKSTNVLLVIVVFVSLISAFLAAGLAILFM